MRVQQEQVQLFHEKMDYPVASKPQLVDVTLARQRVDFLLEEVDEYSAAVMAGDLVGVADALTDIAYILLGTAVVHGIDLEPIFDAVHRSNMTKDRLDPVTKKGGKGPGYRPPTADIASLLLMQSHGIHQDAA